MLAPQIDLNCDMGEGMPSDADIFPFISSANIACGAHAGDDATMRLTVERALRHGVAIGAHPSYPDRERFGRVDLLGNTLRAEDLPPLLTDQLRRLQKICEESGTRLHHVKPHGALYNRAARDPVVSELIARVVAGFDPSLLLYGLSGSEMEKQAAACGLSFVSEVFADRRYQADGSLVPRSEPHALIEDPDEAIAQVLKMVCERKVQVGETDVPLRADTICIHGDGSHAAGFARMIHDVLLENGIVIKHLL